MRKAARLGVHRGEAARCWVSFTPSRARRSMFGVLRVRGGGGERNTRDHK